MRQSNKWVLGLVVAVGLLAGCKRAADPNTVRFRYWGDTEEVKIIESLLKEFEAANPGVKVKPERKNADASYGDVLLQEFAANTAPDVMFVSTDNVDVLSSSGKLADLNEMLAKESDLKATDYYPTLIKRFSKDGKLLVLPRDIAPVACIYYNKDLFDQAKVPYPKDDWTWDDLREKALKLTIREGESAKQFGFADDWNLSEAWVLAAGGKQMDDYFNPTKFTFADSPGIDGILFRWKLQQVDKVSPSSADNQALNGGAMAMFLNGNLAMFHSGLWKTPSFRKITNFKWDIAGFPRKKGVKNPLYVAGGSGYTMKADAVNKELCWKLVKFMSGKEGQTRIAATGLAQPALMELAASKVFLDGQDPQNKKVLLSLAMNGLASPAWQPWVEYVRAVWGPNTDPIWIKGYNEDPTKVLQDTQALANEKFKDKFAPKQ